MNEIITSNFWATYYQELSMIISLSYLLGSIPFGLIIGKLAGLEDIRKSGSGNIGATNMLRVGGKKLGLAVLICDMAKGAIPVIATYILTTSQEFMMIAGLFALIGHLFPIWLKFKGGKGVATSLGIFFGFSPLLGAITCATWLISAIMFRISSLSALIATSIAPAIGSQLLGKDFAIFLFIIMILVWIKHHANIRRLYLKCEPKIGKSK